jgi:protein TonB
MPFRQGWLGSIALHGLVFLSLFPLFRQSLITIPNEAFHWDVALVQSTPTAHKSGQNTDVPHPTIAKQPDRTPPTSHANHTIHHPAPSAERIASLAQKAEAPVTSTSMADNPSPVPSPSETATSSIPNELPPMTQAHEPPRQQTETPISSMTQAPPQLKTATAATHIEENTPPPHLIQPSSASDAPVASEIRPDYSWLQQAIFYRLEDLKRSSHPFLNQSRPLKVMVRVVVSREGTLLDSAVVTSSGLDRIDQEAMALVQRAFPMQFDRILDRQQIIMRIPITYSRG